MMIRFVTVLTLAAVALSTASVLAEATEDGSASAAVMAEGRSDVVVDKGVRIEFSLTAAEAEARAPAEGELARARFRITDADTGSAISALRPAAWVTRIEPSVEGLSCRERVERYVQGMLSFQADVDLNKYFLLILNDDATISVVDPMLGVSGITQLFTMIPLEAPGEDWVMDVHGKRLFVSLPSADRVAAIDLDTFKVVASADAGEAPVRVAVQPDGRYLWVGNDAAGESMSGVTVLDARTLERVGFVATGRGHHEIAFTDDSLYALITNGADGSLTVVDSQRLERVAGLAVGASPMAVQFSSLSQAAYVAAAEGTLAVIDRDTWQVRQTISTGAALDAFRLDPKGRWGFVAHAGAGSVDVIDVSRNQVAHTVEVGALPHQITFSDTYGYIRHLGSAEVTLVPLPQLTGQDTLGLQTVVFGSRSPGEYPYPSYADAISPTGEYGAMMAANPVDRMVYYYMEGMIAPMGSYSTYGRVPRAVAVVDRSLRETAKGVYEATFRVPASGEFSVALLLDSPWVDSCFSFTAEPDATRVAESGQTPVRVEFVTETRETTVGNPFELSFVLRRAGSSEGLAGLDDVSVLATRPPGNWQYRQRAVSVGEGRYTVSVPADRDGVYYVTVSVPSLGVDPTQTSYTSFRAVTAADIAADSR